MTAVGGSLESVSFKGREFKVAADSDPTFTLGGVEITQEMNGMGTHRELTMPVPWVLSSFKVEIDLLNGDIEYLTNFQLAKGGEIVVTFAGGISYSGQGNITGTLEANPKDASATLSCGGGGFAKRLV